MARIQVFDDSKMVLNIVTSVLQEMNHVVKASCPDSLFEALKCLYKDRPDLLITDYNMPSLNGESLIRAIREDAKLAELKVMVLSAHHESDLIQRILKLGVDGYVLKGGGMKEELPRRVAEILQA
jgi:DNA-binding NarL/FixJ family response regulator